MEKPTPEEIIREANRVREERLGRDPDLPDLADRVEKAKQEGDMEKAESLQDELDRRIADASK